jgi:hypothetical protein
MTTARKQIDRFTMFWRLVRWLECFLFGIGAWGGVVFLTSSSGWSLTAGIITLGIALYLIRPWKINNGDTVGYLDRKLKDNEFSTGLLLISQDELTTIARLQQKKIAERLRMIRWTHITPPHHLIRAALWSILIMVVGYAGSKLLTTKPPQTAEKVAVPLTTTDRNAPKPPEINSATVAAQYPDYTRVGKVQMESMQVTALEGSVIIWNLSVTLEVDAVILDAGNETRIPFKKTGKLTFEARWKPQADALYLIELTKDSVKAVSDIYSLTILPDESPDIQTTEMNAYVSFPVVQDLKEILIQATAQDDFGITDASVVATVSQGSGESVLFREERLALTGLVKGNKTLQLSRKISLDSLGMSAGDELYYYIEVTDNREPRPNVSRTETFFAVIPDTSRQEFMMAGSMGVDLMPDYFRSQRQLIIDTEKLISEKKSLASREFNQRSNALGYDQKLLRLKYGQYLGEEFESGITEDAATLEEGLQEENEEDPTAAYTHDHDGEEEAGDHLHDHEEQEGAEEDPLSSYIHDHSDPEEATLYTAGIRAMLKQAMAEMWDAELHLRLYTPEKSLPFQYKALDLIQKIKNQARIYVQRIGFDPPPIKEENRLTGKLDGLTNQRSVEDKEVNDSHKFIRKAIRVFSEVEQGIIPERHVRSSIFIPASKELTDLALARPGSYLDVLSEFRTLELTEWENISWADLAPGMLKRLTETLPPGEVFPDSEERLPVSVLDSLFLRQLEGRMNE